MSVRWTLCGICLFGFGFRFAETPVSRADRGMLSDGDEDDDAGGGDDDDDDDERSVCSFSDAGGWG